MHSTVAAMKPALSSSAVHKLLAAERASFAVALPQFLVMMDMHPALLPDVTIVFGDCGTRQTVLLEADCWLSSRDNQQSIPNNTICLVPQSPATT